MSENVGEEKRERGESRAFGDPRAFGNGCGTSIPAKGGGRGVGGIGGLLPWMGIDVPSQAQNESSPNSPPWPVGDAGLKVVLRLFLYVSPVRSITVATVMLRALDKVLFVAPGRY